MMLPGAQGPRALQVTGEEVERFCEFLYRRTGMSFTEGKRYYIDRRLAERIAATGATTFQSYFAILRSDAGGEIEHLVNAFTVNETYFYREDHQLRCMTSNLLDEVIRKAIGIDWVVRHHANSVTVACATAAISSAEGQQGISTAR